MADSDSSDDEIPPWSEDEAQNISENHEAWVEYFVACHQQLQNKSETLIKEQPLSWYDIATRYIEWYSAVENYTVELLGRFSISITTTYDQGGQHQHHKNVLENLSERNNPLFELLGKGEVYAALLEAKNNRNVPKDDRRDLSRVTNDVPAWGHLVKMFKGIEAALLVALCLFKLEHRRNIASRETVTMRKSTLDSQELLIWNKARNLEAQEEKSRVTEERLSSQERDLKDRDQQLKWSEDRVKKDDENTRVVLADLERERKAHKEEVKKAKEDLAKIEKQNTESTKMLKTKTQLTKDKEKLAILLQVEKESRNDDTKKALKASGERDQAHKAEIEQLRMTFENQIKRLNDVSHLDKEIE